MFLQEHFSDSKPAKCSYRNTSPETRGAERCCGNILRTQARPRSHDTRPGLAAAEDFGPSVPSGTLLWIGSCDPPGERAVRNKNSLVEMFLQEHPCRSVAFAL